MRKGKYDAPCKREERFLNTLVNLRRRLHKLDAELVRELAALLLRNGTLLRPVRLVADENLVHALGRMLLNVRVTCADVCGVQCETPARDRRGAGSGQGRRVELSDGGKGLQGTRTVERPLVRHVIHEEDTHRSPVVRRGDRPEPLLACSIPLSHARGRGESQSAVDDKQLSRLAEHAQSGA